MTPSKSPVRKSGKVKRVRMWGVFSEHNRMFINNFGRPTIYVTRDAADACLFDAGCFSHPVTVSYSLPQKKQKRKG